MPALIEKYLPSLVLAAGLISTASMASAQDISLECSEIVTEISTARYGGGTQVSAERNYFVLIDQASANLTLRDGQQSRTYSFIRDDYSYAFCRGLDDNGCRGERSLTTISRTNGRLLETLSAPGYSWRAEGSCRPYSGPQF